MKSRKLAVYATAGLISALALPGLAMAEEKPPPPPTKSPCFDIQLADPPTTNKVSLCHFTGGTNFVLNSPGISAFIPHASHHGDCYKFTGEAQVCVL